MGTAQPVSLPCGLRLSAQLPLADSKAKSQILDFPFVPSVPGNIHQVLSGLLETLLSRCINFLGLLQEIYSFPVLEVGSLKSSVGRAVLPPEAVGEDPSCLF